MVQTQIRNAGLDELAKLLQEQHVRKLDVVAPATAVRMEGGQLVLSGTDAQITPDGVTPTDGVYQPTEVCDAHLSEKLGIPLPYVRRLRNGRPDLLDANANGWLHGGGWHRDLLAQHGVGPMGERLPDTKPDGRSFMVRCFRGDDGGPGIARALLSDRYGIMDNLDVLMAALDGVRATGADVQVSGCDLTEQRMRVRVTAPQIAAYAPDLLDGYRSPFDGRDVGGGWTPERVARASAGEGQRIEPGTEPVVFAGFEISNSETGGGAFTLTPRLVVKVCNNGLTITADAIRGVHLGSRLDAGVIRWSQDTSRRALELVTGKTRDAVRTFLDVGYVRAKVAEISERAGAPVTDAARTVELVGAKLNFTQDQQASILDHFIKGGQLTAGGIMHAVTSVAQTVADPEAAAALEGSALRALALAGGGSR